VVFEYPSYESAKEEVASSDPPENTSAPSLHTVLRSNTSLLASSGQSKKLSKYVENPVMRIWIRRIRMFWASWFLIH
jgi:hypothetical protein